MLKGPTEHVRGMLATGQAAVLIVSVEEDGNNIGSPPGPWGHRPLLSWPLGAPGVTGRSCPGPSGPLGSPAAPVLAPPGPCGHWPLLSWPLPRSRSATLWKTSSCSECRTPHLSFLPTPQQQPRNPVTGSSLPHKCNSNTIGSISEIVERSRQLQLLYKTQLTTKAQPLPVDAISIKPKSHGAHSQDPYTWAAIVLK